MGKGPLNRGRVEGVNRVLSPLLIIAMLLFLVAGAIALPQTAQASPGAALGATVQTFEDPAFTVLKTVFGFGDDVYVNATINTLGGTVQTDNVTVNITWEPTGKLSWVSGGGSSSPHTQYLGTIPANTTTTVNWTLNCTALGPVTITVTASGTDSEWPYGQVTASASVTIIQLKAHLEVNITYPEPGANFYVCQNFTVNATVNNTGLYPGNATNVNATITIIGNASLLDGELQTKDVTPVDIPAGGSATVNWTLHCDGPEAVFINVTVNGTDFATGKDLRFGFPTPNVQDDNVTVNQIKAHLVANITYPSPDDTFGVCQNFTVNVTVNNIYNGNATLCNATISVAGNGSLVADESALKTLTELGQDPGNITGYGFATVNWTVHCDGPGPVFINVTVNGTDAFWGLDLRTGFVDPQTGKVVVDVEDDNVTVQQRKAHLNVTIDTPTDSTNFGVCQNITVNATVTNTGNGNATDVSVTLVWTGPAEWVDGANPQTIAPLLQPNQTATGNWTLHCIGMGNVTINVTANGTDQQTGKNLRTGFLPDVNVDDPLNVTVHQLKAHLVTTIDTPTPDEKFGVCQNITVNVTVNNTGNGDAINVNATITWTTATASLVAGAQTQAVNPPILQPGQLGTVNWTLHCDGPGPVFINVTINGTDSQTDKDLRFGFPLPNVEDANVTVNQVKAHLVATIDTPISDTNFGVCQNITVNVTVTNTGNGNATYVNATLVWTGPADFVTGDNPKELGTLINGTSATVNWTLHCNAPGDVTINVTANGTDEQTGKNLRTEFDPPNVEDPANVTVHQLKAHLVATIDTPSPDTNFGVCQDFMVNVTVNNIGNGTATNVTITITLYSHASLVAPLHELWNETYSGQGTNNFHEYIAYGVATDSEGNVIVTGGPAIISYNTIKYNGTDGTELWNVTYHGPMNDDVAYGVATDSQGDVIVTGYSANATWSRDYYTIKYNGTDGTPIWNATYDGGYMDEAHGVATDSEDNVIVTGLSWRANPIPGDYDYYTIKYNGTDGTEIWNATYDGGHDDAARGVATDSEDNVIVTGQSYNATGCNTYDYCTIKYDQDGNELWNATYDGGYADYAKGVATDWQRNVIVTGFSENATTGNYDYYTIKYDPDGTELWNRTYDGGGNDYARGVATDSLANIIVTGGSQGSGSRYYTIKYDPQGNELWHGNINSDGYDTAYAVATDPEDNVIVTGGRMGFDHSYVTVKYGVAETLELGDIPAGGNATGNWTLHCDGMGDVTINVTVDGIDAQTGKDLRTGFPTPNVEDPDNVTVHQRKAHLKVEIDTPQTCNTFNTLQNITVNATVNNTGNWNATDVTLTISLIGGAMLIDGDQTQSVGNLTPGELGVGNWTLQCTARGDLIITVSANGTDEQTGKDLRTGFMPPNVEDDNATVHQVLKAHLVVNITYPLDGGNVTTYQDFKVYATITNVGDENATDCNATITITPGTGQASTAESLTKATDPTTILGGNGTATVNWTLHCDGAGTVDINVTADGTHENTGLRIQDDNIVPDNITVNQQDPPILEVEVLSPDSWIWLGTCQNFVVTASVTNVGDATATNVTATVYISAHASVVSPGASIDVGTLVKGESKIVTWTLHCDSPEKSIITINATGDDINTGLPINPVPISWIRDYDSRYDDYATAVAVDSNDNVIVTGRSYNGGDYDYYTIKYDKNGNVLWEEVFDSGNDDLAFGVAVDSSDNIIVTGTSYDGSSDNYYTIKYDPHGNMLWTKFYDSGDDDEAWAVAVDSNDNIIVTGYSYNGVTDNYCTVKYDQYGNVMAGWPQHYDGGDDDWAYSVAVDSDDNVIVTGTSNDGYSRNYYTIKYDKNGNVLWSKVYDGYYHDWATAVAVDLQDNIIVTGYVWNGTYINFDYYTIKYDPQGNEIWNATFNGGYADMAFAVAIDSGDNIVVTGGYYPAGFMSPPYSDYYTIEYDPNGNEIWNRTYNGSANDWARGVAVDSHDNVIVTGSSDNGATYDYYTIKYHTTPDYLIVLQYAKAHLVVDIVGTYNLDGTPQSTLSTLQVFNLTATVTNTGWADAWDVTLTLSAFPEGSVRVVPEDGYTKYIGALTGHGENGNATVNWTLQCKAACDSTITITAAGYDEYGVHFKQRWVDPYYENYSYYQSCYGFHGFVAADVDGDIEGYVVWMSGWFDGYIGGSYYVGDYGPDWVYDNVDGYFRGYIEGILDVEGYIDGDVVGNATLPEDCAADYAFAGDVEAYVAGDIEGYCDDLNADLTGYFYGEFDGYFDGYVNGDRYGWVEGWFEGSIDSTYYPYGYYGPVYLSGHVDGWFDGYFGGFVYADPPGTFYGYVDGYAYSYYYCDGYYYGSIEGYVEGDLSVNGFIDTGEGDVDGYAGAWCLVEGQIYHEGYWVEDMESTAGRAIPLDNIVPDSFTVKQEEAAHLVVEIVNPLDQGTYSACQYFTVIAKVYNTGTADALNVTLTIDIHSAASLAPSELWHRTYHSEHVDDFESDYAYSVATDGLNNVIVTGYSYDGSTVNYYTIKYDPDGTELWNRTYNGGSDDYAYGVATDALNNVIVSGTSYNVTTWSWDYYTIKYDPDGTELWNRNYDGGNYDCAYSVATDALNNVIVTGCSYNVTTGSWDYYTIKYDPDGTELWNRNYDGGNYDCAYSVATDALRNVIVTGCSYDGSTDNYYTIKYDPQGNELWNRTYDGGDYDEGRGVATDALNNVIVTGQSYDGSTVNYYTIKYDPNGTELWHRTYDGGDEDYATGVATDGLNNVIVTGQSHHNPDGDCDYYTIAYDPDGADLWRARYDGGVYDYANGVATDGLNNVIVTGSSYLYHSDGDDEYYTIKYAYCSPTQFLGDIPGGGWAEASWTLHCDGSGDAEISVTPAGIDENTGEEIGVANLVHDQIIVHQEDAAELMVTITAPNPDEVFSTCQDFVVTATITNIGEAIAEDVTASLTIDANASIVSGPVPAGSWDIPGGGSVIVSWIVHCDRAGASTLNVTANGADENSGVALTASADVTVQQELKGHLAVTNIVPMYDGAPQYAFSTGQIFTVIVTINNTGAADALNVTATIYLTGGISLVPGETPIKDVSYIPGGASDTVEWTLQCDSEGVGVITVVPAGIDENTGMAIPDENIDPYSVPVNQYQNAHLLVIITAPEYSTTYSSCQNFTVTATVTNTGQAMALNATATITIDGPASLVGEPATKDLGNIPGGSTVIVRWQLHCDGSGDVNITVNASGTDENTHDAIPEENLTNDTIRVHQETRASLNVTSVAPSQSIVSTCQDFTVTAQVTNEGEAAALDVTAWLSILPGTRAHVVSGPFPASVDLAGGASQNFTWTLHCDGSGVVNITVVPTGIDENTGRTIWDITTNYTSVNQESKAHLVVSSVVPSYMGLPQYQYSTCQNFNVTATVNNTGQADALNVTATITINQGASLVGMPPTKYIGTIPGGDYAVVNWTLHCDVAVPSLITVTPAGIDENTLVAIPDDNIDPYSVAVNQYLAARLLVDITAPPYCTMFSTCQNFTVIATVTNTGEATALNVTATITIDPTAELVNEPATKGLGNIPGGATVDVQWHLHCVAAGDVNITVDAAGIDENTHIAIPGANLTNDTITVHQETRAHLSVIAIAPSQGTVSTCQDFTVTATVKNTGQADALGVTVELSIAPATGAHVVSGPAPASVDLAGGANQTFTWTLHCDSTEDVTITATPSGTDENTGEAVYDIDTNFTTVGQEQKAHLVVTSVVPSYMGSPQYQYSTSQEFNITATVNNTGEAAALNVTATIWIDANCSLLPGEPPIKSLGTILSGGSATVVWALRCDSPGASLITVVPAGIDENTHVVIPDDNIDPYSVPVNQYLEARLVVIITAPAYDTTYSSEQNFTVTVTVTNTGQAAALNATATITIVGPATLLGEPLTKELGNIPGGMTVVERWHLQCTGSGDVNITVIPAGIDENTHVAIPVENLTNDTVTVHQEAAAELRARFWASQYTVSTCQEFTIYGQIYNDGEAWALDVTATILMEYNTSLVAGETATKAVGDIPGGGNSTGVTWKVHCDGAGETWFWFFVEGTDENTGQPIPWHNIWLYSDSIGGYVTQDDWASAGIKVTQEQKAHLVVTDIVPTYMGFPQYSFSTCQNFTVTATIENTGEAVAEGVTATISISGGASLLPGEPPTKAVADIAGGETATVRWAVHCDSSGETVFTVTPAGIDENTGVAIPGEDIVPYSVPVDQYLKAQLVVDITAPEYSTTYSTCQNFTVTATVTNTGEAAALDVTATISIDGLASLVGEPETKELGTIPGGATVDVQWQLHCDGAGDVVISVTAAGYDEFAYWPHGGFIDASISLDDADIYVDGFFEGGVYGYFDGDIAGEFESFLAGYFSGMMDGGYYSGYYNGYFDGNVDGNFVGDIWGPAYFEGNVDGRFIGDVEGTFTGSLMGTVDYGEIGHGSVDVCFDGYFNGDLDGWFEGNIDGDFTGWFEGYIDGSYYDGYGSYTFDGYVAGHVHGAFSGDVDGSYQGVVDSATFGGYISADYAAPCEPVAGSIDGLIYMWGADIYADGFFEGWVNGYFEGDIAGYFDGDLDGYFTGTFDGSYYSGYYNGYFSGPVDGYFVGDIAGDYDGFGASFEGNVDGHFIGGIWGYYDGYGMFTGSLIGTVGYMGAGIDHGSVDVSFDGWVAADLDGWVEGDIDGTFTGWFEGYIDGSYWDGYGSYTFDGYVAGHVHGNFQGNVDGSYQGLVENAQFYGDIGGGYVVPGCVPVTPDTVTVHQEQAAELWAYFWPSQETVSTCQEFTVYAEIYNSGEAWALDVTITILTDEKTSLVAGETATKAVGDIPGGNYTEVVWKLHCDSAGLTSFWFIVEGTDENTGQPIPWDNIWLWSEGYQDYVPQYGWDEAGISVTQELKAHLVVTDIVPEYMGLPQYQYSTSQEFSITATINNTGEAAALNVTAAIWIDANCSLLPGQTPIKTVGSGTILGGGSATVEWLLRCDSPGASLITVVPAGIDENTHVAIPDDNIDPWSVVVNQYLEARLVVIITAPAYDTTYSNLQNFTVTVTVTNTGQAAALNANATIVIDGPAMLLGEPATKELGNIPGGMTVVERWHLQCTGSGDVNITVIPAGIDENTHLLIPVENLTNDTIRVHQETKAHLVVTAIAPSQGTVSTCQDFTVTATVKNTGQADALGVTVELSIVPATGAHIVSGPAPASVDLGGGASQAFTWTLHCDSTEDVTITATPSGIDENTGNAVLAANIVPNSTSVTQELKAHLVVTDIVPEYMGLPQYQYSTSQEFSITATINNTGEAAALNVTAAIWIDANCSLLPGQTPIKTVGSGTILGGGSATVEWLLRCDSPGASLITVVPAGIDENTHVAIPDDNIDPYSVPVNQYLEARLVVIITAPAYDTTYSTEQNFTVTVTVTNTGQAAALNANATIVIVGPATLLGEPATKELGNIPGGMTVVERWHLQCTGSGDVNITVIPAGIDENTHLLIPVENLTNDTIRVHQETKAHLRVTSVVSMYNGLPQSTFSTEQEFQIVATVTNLGDANALDVTLTISIDHAATLVAGETETKAIGNIIGHGTAPAVSWTLRCDSAGSSTITVTPAGIDENTGKPIYNIDTNNTTVTQVNKAHLVVTEVKTYHTDGTPQSTFSTEQSFDVTATVKNIGQADALNVTATIDPGATCALGVGESVTKTVGTGTIGGGLSAQVTWRLQCEGSGQSTITVTPAGVDENTAEAILPDNIQPNSTTVQQELKAHLVLEIVLPADGSTFSTEQNFTVKVKVHNIGEANATNVIASIVVVPIPPAAQNVVPATNSTSMGSIAGETYKEVIWQFYCSGPGSSQITVTASGTDENTKVGVLAANIVNDTIVINQERKAHLVTDITQPYGATGASVFSSEQTFVVSANITNTGQADALGVTANLVIVGNAVVVSGDNPQYVGEIIGGGTNTAVWTLECTGNGTVSITVTPAGIDENTLEAIKSHNIVSDTIIVYQENKAHLVVSSIVTRHTDMTLQQVFSTEQVFYVNVTISNLGNADALNVTATIDPGVTCALGVGEQVTKNLGTIAGLNSKAVSWVLECRGSGESVIVVTPAGVDENTGGAIPALNIQSNSTTVDQELKAHLVLEIVLPADGSTFSTEQNFTVKVKVHNIGEANATGVTASIVVVPIPPAGQNVNPATNSTSMGTIAGETYKEVIWQFYCSGPGSSQITVTASGTDENTKVGVLAANIVNDTIVINQETKVHLVTDITQPLGATGESVFSTEQEFSVIATISNTGEANALSVTAAIAITDGAALVEGESAVKVVGDIIGGGRAVVSWTLVCTGTDTVSITVAPAGIDENTLEAIKSHNIVNDTITVEQETKAHLVITSVVPKYQGAVQYTFSTEQEFQVEVTLWNMGEATATWAYLGIYQMSDNVELVAGQSEYTGWEALQGNQKVNHTWTFRCTGSGSATINFIAGGYDENTGEAIPEDNMGWGQVIVAQELKAHLVVDIIAPQDGTTFSSEQTFEVRAKVTNTGQAVAEGVFVTISIDGPASTAQAGKVAVGNIIKGQIVTVSWTLNCTGSGDVYITVDASGTDENTGKAIARANIEDDQIIVHQELKAHLVAEITTPQAGTTYSTEQTFLVSATISNIGEAAALGVSAKLTISGAGSAVVVAGDNPRDLGTIIGGGQATVSWTLECSGSGDVTVTVTPAGVDENTNKPIYNITPDTVTILHQEAKAHLVVVIQPPKGATGESMFSTGQSFTVKVVVKNTGEASALNVRATIDPGANCALGQGESATKDVCVVPCALEGGHSAAVTWTLQCEGEGKSVISVTVVGVDENTGKAIVSANIEPDTYTVEQEQRASLVVTSIESLYQGSPQTVFSSEQEFDVNVTVTNFGAADAINCTATIAIVGPASLVFGAPAVGTPVTLAPALQAAPGETATQATDPTTIPGVGGTGTVSWHLRCTGSGTVTITVTPAGIDENTGVAVITPDDIQGAQIVVTQEGKGELEVTITAPADGTTFFIGQEFVVTAIVTNSGEAIVQDVSAAISIDDHSSLVAGESAAKALGDMASGESKTVSWTLRSDTAGDSTINVTANGTDENTGQDVLGVTTVSASITVEQASQLPWWLIPIFVGFLLFAAVVWVAWRRVRS